MIPDFQTLLLPVLKASASGMVRVSEVVEPLAAEFGLTSEELEVLTPDKKDELFRNRVGWARAYLKQANLIESPKWGYFQITNDGRTLLNNPPTQLNVKFLKTIPAYANHVPRPRKEKIVSSADDENVTATPDESLEAAYLNINSSVSAELLERLQNSSPAFFERSIVALLLAMGYGVDETSGAVVGRTGDGGIDGVIDQDRLGVDQIYIQAKRYAEGNKVSASDIRDFFGSLNIRKAQKGILATTSDFTPDALRTAKELSSRIVLINGTKLGELMLEYNVGCRIHKTLSVKRIDEDFFE